MTSRPFPFARLASAVAVVLGAGLLTAPMAPASAADDPVRVDQGSLVWNEVGLAYSNATSLVDEGSSLMVFTAQSSGSLSSVDLVGTFRDVELTATVTEFEGFVAPSGETAATFGATVGTAERNVTDGTGNVSLEFSAAGSVTAGDRYVIRFHSDFTTGSGQAILRSRTVPAGDTTTYEYATYVAPPGWTEFRIYRTLFSLNAIPPITAIVTPNGDVTGAGWHVVAPSVDFTCDSNVSAGCPVDIDAAPDTSSALSGTATVDGASYAWTLPLKVDTTRPSLTGTAVTPVGGGGVYDSDIVVEWTCEDTTSGLDSGCPDDSTVSGRDGATVATATVRDLAGNETTTSVSGLVRRAGAPIISISGVEPGRSYAYGTKIAPTCSATSALGGSLPCTGATTESTAGDGGSAFTYTATANDPRGVAGEASVSWTVQAAPKAGSGPATAHQVKVTGLPKKKVQGNPSVKAGKKVVLKLRIRTATGAVVKVKPSVRIEGLKAPKVRKAGTKKNVRWTVTVKFPKKHSKTVREVAIVTGNGTVRTLEFHVA